MFNWFQKRRRRKILNQVWPESWTGFLNHNIAMSYGLSPTELDRLKARTKILVAEKHWEGIEGLTITEEIKVTIAAQASVMLLGAEDFYFDNVRTILVFPEVFQREINDGTGVRSQHLSGEAWQGGPIVLSWANVLRGCRHGNTGSNVVIHEFAHALDGLDGHMGGNILFDDRESLDDWERVVQHDFEELVEAKRAGHATLLDPYGATSKAEFFAVATETFFELPHEMCEYHVELFSLLVKYFNVDPTNWQ